MNRIRGLQKIKSVEEYNKLKNELKAEVEEYVALSENSSAIDIIKNEFETTINSLDKNTSDEDKANILKKACLLETKYNGLKDGTYLAALKRNITANLIRIEQYEAEIEKVSFMKIVAGILKNDNQIKQYIQRRFMISIANRDGVAPAAVDLVLEDPGKVMKYIIENKKYNFVGIKADDVALVPIEQSANPRAVETSVELRNMTDEFIKESMNQEESTKIDNTAVKHDRTADYTIRYSKRLRTRENDTKEIE